MTAGFDVLNSYSTTVANLAVEIGKRKVISSSSSNNSSSNNSSSCSSSSINNSSCSRQGVMNVSTDDDGEDINKDALTIKEIIFGMALKKVKICPYLLLSPLNLVTDFFL